MFYNKYQIQIVCIIVASLFLFFFLDLPRRIIEQLGSVGVSMSVAVNPINTMALQLRERAMELEQKRASLEARELEVKKDANAYRLLALGTGSALFLLAIIFIRHLYYDRK